MRLRVATLGAAVAVALLAASLALLRRAPRRTRGVTTQGAAGFPGRHPPQPPRPSRPYQGDGAGGLHGRRHLGSYPSSYQGPLSLASALLPVAEVAESTESASELCYDPSADSVVPGTETAPGADGGSRAGSVVCV